MIGVMFSNILFFGRRLPVLFLPRSPAVIGSRRFPLHFYILRVLFIRHMLHNILNVAFQNGADTVKGKNLMFSFLQTYAADFYSPRNTYKGHTGKYDVLPWFSTTCHILS